VLAVAAVLAGCGTEPKAASTVTPSVEPERRRLPPVALPDLAGMEATVQQQLRDRYQSLMALIENPVTAPADLARGYGNMGRLLMAAEYFEAAEPFYLHAQALAPEEMRWPYYLGHVYMAQSDPVQAIAAFERALRLQPGDVATLVWLGNVQLDQGRPELADPLFARALVVQPRDVSALFGRGQAALARRDYSRAVEQLEQVLSADRRASIAHYPLALAYRGLGDSARAEAHLSQQGGVEVGPPDPLMVELRGLLHGAVAEENRGVRALDSGDFTGAAAHFRKGIELAPDSPSLRHKLGTALSLTGDTRGAIEQFEEAVRRSPGFAQAHYSLGVLLAAQGHYAEAIRRLSTAVRDEPTYLEARLQLAETLRRSGQMEQALAEYRQVLRLDPRVTAARFGYAMTLGGLQRYDEARAALSEGVRLHPDEPRFGEALARLESALAGRR
jgi:tetratricopeptide (TPR) repeat protein